MKTKITRRNEIRRKRLAATDNPGVQHELDSVKKKKKKSNKKKTKNRKSGDDAEVAGPAAAASSSLMDSIFNSGNGGGDGINVNDVTTPSLMDSIFDRGSNENAATAEKSSSSSVSLFDNPTVPLPLPSTKYKRKKAPETASPETLAATTESNNYNEADTIRRTLQTRRHQSEHRPLLRKALDFPGVFRNEEQNEESGFFLLDDELERAKETADAVRDHGLCVIRNVIDTTDNDGDNNDDNNNHNLHPLRNVVLPAAKSLQNHLNKALTTRNIHHSTETFRFREAASRCKGRTDVVLDNDIIGREILRNPKLYPVIQNLLGGGGGDDDDDSDNDNEDDDVKLVYAGLIFSYPGSCDQPWHQDGMPLFPELPGDQSAMLQASFPPYALNVFLPLEDDDGSVERGPTEFLPGSHKWTSGLDERLRLATEPTSDGGDKKIDSDSETNGDSDKNDDCSDEDAIVAPVLKQGDALIYDYRVCHRGTANLFGKLEALKNCSTTDTNGSTASKKSKKKKKPRNDDNDDDIAGTRRILYLMYARPWFTDHVNFDYTKSAESLFNSDGSSSKHNNNDTLEANQK